MKRSLKALVQQLPLQRARAWRLRRKAQDLLFDWSRITDMRVGGRTWSELVEKTRQNADAPSVLIATTVGAQLATMQFDSLLAVAMTLRGARVSFVLCDAALPACMADQHDWQTRLRDFAKGDGKRPVCAACWPVGELFLGPLGLQIHRLGDVLTVDDRREALSATAELTVDTIRSWHHDGMAVGEHAMAGALRFQARSDLDGVPYADDIIRRFARGGLLAARAATRVIEKVRPTAVVAHHGIYAPQGLWVEAARRTGTHVVTWNPGYRTGTFLFSHGDTYHKTMIDEDTTLWEYRALSPEEDRKLSGYLDARRSGASDWISFGSGRTDRHEECMRQLGLDTARPTVLLLTSVAWDAQLHYDSNAFPDQTAWLDETIDYFKTRHDLNLVIRIHPAEITGFVPSRQRLHDYILKRHGPLPETIRVVPPDDPTNTYALIDGCDTALIYSTKTGIEIAARGKPVVVAGEAWIRGKGFSRDASSPEDYRAILDALPAGGPISEAARTRARRYASHFFFRRMVRIPGFRARKGWPPYVVDVATLGQLAPRADPNLDMVCDNLLNGRPFLAETTGFEAD